MRQCVAPPGEQGRCGEPWSPSELLVVCLKFALLTAILSFGVFVGIAYLHPGPGACHAPNKQPGSPSRVEAAALGSLACLLGYKSFCCLSEVGEVRDPTTTQKSYFFFCSNRFTEASSAPSKAFLFPHPPPPALPPPRTAPSQTSNPPRAFLPLGPVTPVRSL